MDKQINQLCILSTLIMSNDCHVPLLCVHVCVHMHTKSCLHVFVGNFLRVKLFMNNLPAIWEGGGSS